ncbi:hypothetical protein [Paulownia witches'-broom phytoplasma]|uniref:hypothetical protein n=1 Tax=Paulownia witches'-broom phytoplasma TaxID=39647 RepID=UPI002D1EBE14|nr:hypothetical protein PAWBP_7520 [Paulownia witches'-broom phytoplasma]
MNIIIKKNQLFFKNIFSFFILFFIILINKNLVFASFSEKNDLELKEKFLFLNNESGKIEEKVCSVSKKKLMRSLYNKKHYEKNRARIRNQQREFYEKKFSSYKELIQKKNFEEEKNYRDSKTLQLFK